MGKEAKMRAWRKRQRAAGIIPKANQRKVWDRADEARYRKFHSIQKLVVPDFVLGGTKEVLIHLGRVVSEAYIKRLAKKELYDMAVRAKIRAV
jgi:hypothetical protein